MTFESPVFEPRKKEKKKEIITKQNNNKLIEGKAQRTHHIVENKSDFWRRENERKKRAAKKKNAKWIRETWIEGGKAHATCQRKNKLNWNQYMRFEREKKKQQCLLLWLASVWKTTRDTHHAPRRDCEVEGIARLMRCMRGCNGTKAKNGTHTHTREKGDMGEQSCALRSDIVSWSSGWHLPCLDSGYAIMCCTVPDSARVCVCVAIIIYNTIILKINNNTARRSHPVLFFFVAFFHRFFLRVYDRRQRRYARARIHTQQINVKS